MAQQLIDAIASSGVTLVVIDFEYTTPKGASPEPIEVAVQALQVRDGQLERGAAAEVLMRPPEHAALMAFDIEQTGITPEMLADVPPAGEVLAQLDRRFTSGPYLLVAHSAAAEARLLANYQQACPNLAHTDLLDTVRLARVLYPDLDRHGLDHLIFHLKMQPPANRHRAMGDVQVTTDLFIRMLQESSWADLRELRKIAGITAEATKPVQASLFG